MVEECYQYTPWSVLETNDLSLFELFESDDCMFLVGIGMMEDMSAAWARSRRIGYDHHRLKMCNEQKSR